VRKQVSSHDAADLLLARYSLVRDGSRFVGGDLILMGGFNAAVDKIVSAMRRCYFPQ